MVYSLGAFGYYCAWFRHMPIVLSHPSNQKHHRDALSMYNIKTSIQMGYYLKQLKLMFDLRKYNLIHFLAILFHELCNDIACFLSVNTT